MRAFVANTDFEWYLFLSGRADLDEVNFWRPSGGTFRALSAGEPLLFRLKAPHNAIAGVGFFVHFSVLPASLAWVAFEVKNGAASEEAMRSRTETYRRRRPARGHERPAASLRPTHALRSRLRHHYAGAPAGGQPAHPRGVRERARLLCLQRPADQAARSR